MKKKFLASLAMLVLVLAGTFSPVFGVFGNALNAQVAHAQLNGQLLPDPNATPDGPGGAPDGTGSELDPNTPDTQVANDNAAQEQQSELECGVNPVCRTVKNYITLVTAPSYIVAALSGFFLDYVLWSTITSSSYSETSGIGSIATTGWKIIRDFTNLLFIFALFAVAFNLILNVNVDATKGASAGNGFGLDPKRTIARILLMALLVNFSFFLAKSVIDISNTVAYTFFNKITVTGADSSVDSTLNTVSNVADSGISGLYSNSQIPGIKSISLAILASANPQALVLNTVQGSDGSNISLHGFTIWGSYDWSTYVSMLEISMLSSFFNFFLIFIFISLGVILLGRTLGLVFAIIVSPIAFVSFAIPSLESQPYVGFTDWFSEFVKLALTAPVLIFFMYLVITFLKTPFLSEANAGFFVTASLIVLKLSAVGGLLILAKKVTKNLAGRAGAIATKVAVSVATTAAVVGVTAATGGGAAVLSMGRRYAMNKGRELAANGISKVTGQNVEAVQQRLSGGLKNFASGSFDKAALMKGAAGAVLGEGAYDSLKGAATYGKHFKKYDDPKDFEKVMDRKENIDRIRRDRKRGDEIDGQLRTAKKKFNNPATSAEDKAALKGTIDKLTAERKEIDKRLNPKGTPPPAPATNPTPTPAAPGANPAAAPQPSVILDKNGNPMVKDASAAPAAAPKTAVGNVDLDDKKGTGTQEQIKTALDRVEGEMRSIEKELNEPATRANKNRTEELEKKYSELEGEQKSVKNGTIPPRLMNVPGTPLGSPNVAAGTGILKAPVYNGQVVAPKPPVPQPVKTPVAQTAGTGSSAAATASLLSGISGGSSTEPVSEAEPALTPDQLRRKAYADTAAANFAAFAQKAYEANGGEPPYGYDNNNNRIETEAEYNQKLKAGDWVAREPFEEKFRSE